MVFFSCNACGQAVKKNQVEKHYLTKCRNCTVLSCIDCGKDFRGEEYQDHTKCITEDEKYGGKDYKPKPSSNKGEAKQANWIANIKAYISSTHLPQNIVSVLNKLITYDNIPRKKLKFQNFLKNSIRIQNKLEEEVWEIFSKANQSKESPNVSENKSQEQVQVSTNSQKSNGNLITEPVFGSGTHNSGEVNHDNRNDEHMAEVKDNFKAPEKKRKKKRVKSEEEVNEEEPPQETKVESGDGKDSASDRKKKRKKRDPEEETIKEKKKKIRTEEVVNEELEQEKETEVGDVNDMAPERNRKIKRKEETFDEEFSLETGSENRRKKKKHKKHRGDEVMEDSTVSEVLENGDYNHDSSIPDVQDSLEADSDKMEKQEGKKKKKHRKDKSSVVVEDEAVLKSDKILASETAIQDVQSVHSHKKKKKKKL